MFQNKNINFLNWFFLSSPNFQYKKWYLCQSKS